MRELSRRLQLALLPRNAPSLPGYDIAAGTTSEVEGHGSSLWDWFALPDGRLVLYTLDAVPGEFPPAHGLALARAFLRELSPDGGEVGSLVRRVNAAVSRTSVTDLDASVDCGVLVLGGERATWLGAGTVPGCIIRRGGLLEELSSSGPPLGLLDGFRYGAEDVALGPGDVAVVLSHGARGLLRGAADVVAELHGKPAGEVVSKLHKAIQRAGGGGDQREHSVLFVRKR